MTLYDLYWLLCIPFQRSYTWLVLLICFNDIFRIFYRYTGTLKKIRTFTIPSISLTYHNDEGAALLWACCWCVFVVIRRRRGSSRCAVVWCRQRNSNTFPATECSFISAGSLEFVRCRAVSVSNGWSPVWSNGVEWTCTTVGYIVLFYSSIQLLLQAC